MIFTQKWRVKEGVSHFYVLGPASLVTKAAQNVFLQLGWNAKWGEHSILRAFPDGWVDRVGSAFVRAKHTLESDFFAPNVMWIMVQPTNNVGVSLLKTGCYLKITRFNRESRIKESKNFTSR
jgi:hypothetical protein